MHKNKKLFYIADIVMILNIKKKNTSVITALPKFKSEWISQYSRIFFNITIQILKKYEDVTFLTKDKTYILKEDILLI